jgi:hypothetical protein
MSEQGLIPKGVRHGPFPDDGTSYSQSKGLSGVIREAYDGGTIDGVTHAALQNNLKTLGHAEIVDDIERTFEDNS